MVRAGRARRRGLLEAREEFRYGASVHLKAKHPSQVCLEALRENGDVEAILQGPTGATVPRFDLRHLLVMLTRTDDYEMRRKLLTLTKAVLQTEHGIYLC